MKNSRQVSGIKTTHGRMMLPKLKKQIKKRFNNLQAQHSEKLSFHAFNICIFLDRANKVEDSLKYIFG